MSRPPMIRWTFRVPAELLAAAKRKADERGEDLSEVIRDALKRYVRRTK
ncbi:MAG TPA: ribbon-helix-helix protein, CopG family [Terrimesophilobacter sp.]|nr:ribbon-helix-helix protein, CopG family [Terrimesophilobacter sp.]